MTVSSKLSRCVVSSSRLASIFDWKKTSRLLSVHISKHQISLSLAQHPSVEDRHVIDRLEHIPYMPMEQRNMSRAMFLTRKEKVKQELGMIIKEFKVSGFIVGWPLEPSGQPGAACGRVLHLLDFLADKRGGGKSVSPARPLTLWDQRVFTHNQFDELKRPQDAWGRSAAFCSNPNNDERQEHINEKGEIQQMYISSHGKDQVCLGEGDCSKRLLEQFLDSHYTKTDDRIYTRYSKKVPFDRYIANFENHRACIESNLL